MNSIRTVSELKEVIEKLPNDMPIVRTLSTKVTWAHFVDGFFSTWCYSKDGHITNCCSRPNSEKSVRVLVLNVS